MLDRKDFQRYNLLGSVGSNSSPMNREPQWTNLGVRGCLVFRTVRERNYEELL